MSTGAITVTLDAVIVAVTSGTPRILTVDTDAGLALPTGRLDPVGDATLELALRRYVLDQAGLTVGYVEQLYTFGDRDRVRPGEGREISLSYLALVQEEQPAPGASWIDWYALFPWEDHRTGRPAAIDAELLPALTRWDRSTSTAPRIAVSFGVEPTPWDGIRVLERYELLYEARVVAEALVDAGSAPRARQATGVAMAYDHRRIAATALGRLRGKLTYRPVVFELLPAEFTLRTLQNTIEALSGIGLHTQNFRRLVDRGRLVEGTGRRALTGGRPAELFRFRPEVQLERPRPGVGVPYRRA